MNKILDSILLSDTVVYDFYEYYNKRSDFKRWLKAILEEVDMCEKQQQNTPWHKYNVLSHILHSVEAMNKMTKGMDIRERRLLAYVMFFHDLGKAKCHHVDIKTGQDRFFYHNEHSARIAEEALPLFFNQYFTPEEINVIVKLVYKHDIFMFIKDFSSNNPFWKTLSPELIDNEIKELNSVGDGLKLMRYLVMVGRADNLAQNEKMTKDSLALLDKFDGMLDELEGSSEKV